MSLDILVSSLYSALPWFGLGIVICLLGFLAAEYLYYSGLDAEAKSYIYVATMSVFLMLAFVSLIITFVAYNAQLLLILVQIQIFAASIFLWFSYKKENYFTANLIAFNMVLFVFNILTHVISLHLAG